MSAMTETKRLAWELHKQWCQAGKHGAPCWGPIPKDYADAEAQIAALRTIR